MVKAKHLIRIAALIVIGGAFVWVLARLDWHQLGGRLADASPAALVAMSGAWLAGLLLRPMRLWYLMAAIGRVRGRHYWTIWAAIVIGMAVNSFAPMRAGDAMSAYFLRQRLRIGLHQSFTAVIVDRLCDFISVIAIFLGALAFAPPVTTWTSQAVMVLVAGLLAAGAGFWGVMRYRAAVLVLVDRILARLAPQLQARWHEMAEEIFEGLAAIGGLEIAVPVIVISAMMWGLTGLSYWFGLRAVYVGAPIAGAAFAMAAVALSFVVPLGPGGLGVFEAATVLALAVFGVPLEAAIAFAVISHIFQLLGALLLAVLALLTQNIDYRSLRAATQKR